MSKVRGIRFSESEEALVEEFLKKNPFLDFTTLAKISIVKFIKSPSIDLKPVLEKKLNRKYEARHEAN